jgi:flagellar biosynthesis protein FlhB
MAERRPFPPSPRRRALARRAGLHAASPLLVGGGAAAAALIALGAVAGTLADRLGAAIAAACRGTAVLAAPALPGATIAAALPVLGAAAIAAVVAHLAQTRGVWLPRRRLAGAPAPQAGAAPRARRAAGELAAAAGIAGVALAWLWRSAPEFAALTGAAAGAAAAAPRIAGGAAAIAVAWLALGAIDALARHAALARALAMTAAEKRDDDRLAGADPRWRTQRAALRRSPDPGPAIASATLLIVGEAAAVAVAWDPARRPVPVRTAAGRGPRAAQLLGLARRHGVAIHRDPALAAALVDGDGPVPRRHWPRLAEIVAALRGRDRRA